MKGNICKNPNCYTHKEGWTFSVSTAMNEQDYCSLTCENFDKRRIAAQEAND